MRTVLLLVVALALAIAPRPPQVPEYKVHVEIVGEGVEAAYALSFGKPLVMLELSACQKFETTVEKKGSNTFEVRVSLEGGGECSEKTVKKEIPLLLDLEPKDVYIKVIVEKETSGEEYKVHVRVVEGEIDYTYKVQERTLILQLSKERANPCQHLQVWHTKIGPNRFEVRAALIQEGEVCVQVLPETPAQETIKLNLDPEPKDVYIDVYVVTIEKIKLVKPCEELRKRMDELKQKLAAASEEERSSLEKELARLAEEYTKLCEQITSPPSQVTVTLPEDPCETLAKIKELVQEGTLKGEEVKELMRRFRLECEKETPEEIITKVVERVREEVEAHGDLNKIRERIHRAVGEYVQILHEKGEKLKIKAKELKHAIKITKKGLQIGPVDVNVETEIQIDENTKLIYHHHEITIVRPRVTVNVEGEVEVTPEGKLVSVRSQKEIKVDPEKVIKQLKIQVKEIKLEDEGEGPKYKIKGLREGKLLWIIPVSYEVEADVNAETGEIIAQKAPWWAFLVFG